jgi:multidrug efflux pump subunit AcrA (membrane-fusion protein)
MGPHDLIHFILGVLFIGAIIGVPRRLSGARRGGGGKDGTTAAELRATRDRLRTLEAQLLDAQRRNDELQKQLEWHTRLAETQDRLVKELTVSAVRPTVGSAF